MERQAHTRSHPIRETIVDQHIHTHTEQYSFTYKDNGDKSRHTHTGASIPQSYPQTHKQMLVCSHHPAWPYSHSQVKNTVHSDGQLHMETGSPDLPDASKRTSINSMGDKISPTDCRGLRDMGACVSNQAGAAKKEKVLLSLWDLSSQKNGFGL